MRQSAVTTAAMKVVRLAQFQTQLHQSRPNVGSGSPAFAASRRRSKSWRTGPHVWPALVELGLELGQPHYLHSSGGNSALPHQYTLDILGMSLPDCRPNNS